MKIMIIAHRLEMTDGDYVFIAIMEHVPNEPLEQFFSTENKAIRKYFQSLLILTFPPKSGERYKEFMEKLSQFFRDYYHAYGDDVLGYNDRMYEDFYNALIVFSHALNKTIEENGDLTDGYSMARRVWNQTFKGLSGDFYINENGDAKCDFALLDMNPNTGEFEVVMLFKETTQKLEMVKNIHWGISAGTPFDEPLCGFYNEKCNQKYKGNLNIVLATCGSSIIVISIVGFFIFRKIQFEYSLSNKYWKIIPQDIKVNTTFLFKYNSFLDQTNIDDDCTLMQYLTYHKNQNNMERIFGQYQDKEIAIRVFNNYTLRLNRAILIEMRTMRHFNHENINSFIGLSLVSRQVAVIFKYQPKRSLKNFLEQVNFDLDWNFKMSFIQELAEGMIYLHNSSIQFHGRLNSSNCVIGGRLSLKITDFGFRHIMKEYPLQNHSDLLWKAPEFLRLNDSSQGSPEGDVYSFGIIMQEILTRTSPFGCDLNSEMKVRTIIEKVKMGEVTPFRPEIDSNVATQDTIKLANSCWSELPWQRPNFKFIKQCLTKKDEKQKHAVDVLLFRLEKYAAELDIIVEQRTQALREEKQKVEFILEQLLPKSIAQQLIAENIVIPEWFDCVTLYFSDIVGFTALSSKSTAMEVIYLLNCLYSLFDNILSKFDVYKVETIGDAYMVVSGLPIRNRNNHAKEIASMSLQLLTAVKLFKIPHCRKERLKLRIGLHSGSCVAGVVGVKMPRYCLFGNTVNFCAKMESTSEVLKIHVSQPTKLLLDAFDCFLLERRGIIKFREDYEILSYWLLGLL